MLMGTYISQSDVEDTFGTDNIAVWSDLSGAGSADTTRIARAIEYAEEDIENRFRDGRYALPFSPIPNVIKNWCAVIAGIWLFDSRPGFKHTEEETEGFNKLLTRTEATIDCYTSGQRRLETALKAECEKGGPAVVG